MDATLPSVNILMTTGALAFQTMESDDVLALVEQWTTGDAPVLALSLDDQGMSYIARDHIVRIDVDWPSGDEQ